MAMGWKHRLEKILPEMGFEPADGDRLVSAFSGGWQMRMSLGKILLQNPDLLLDEPTNHLDLETIEWLETYLGADYPNGNSLMTGSSSIASVPRLWKPSVFPLTWATTRLSASKAEGTFISTQRLRTPTEGTGKTASFFDRFRASATRTQAKSREKQLEKSTD